MQRLIKCEYNSPEILLQSFQLLIDFFRWPFQLQWSILPAKAS